MIQIAHRKRLLRGFWMIVVLAVVIGSLLPGDSLAIRTLEHLEVSDKIEHFAIYTAVVFLPAIHERWKFVWAVALCTVAMGISLEFGQLYSSGRSFEVADMIADALGVCFGLVIGIPARSSGAVRSLLRPTPTTYSNFL